MRIACGRELEMRDTLRRVRIAEYRIEETHVEIAGDFGLPVRMIEVVELAGDVEGVTLIAFAMRYEVEAAEDDPRALKIDGRFQISFNGQWLLARNSAREVELSGLRLDAVELRRMQRPWHVKHDERNVVGFKVERSVAILEVERSRATVIVQHSAVDCDVAGLEIEKLVESGLAGPRSAQWMRLVGRAVGVDDEMDLGMRDVEIAQENARAEDVKNAGPRAQPVDLHVGRVARIFETVNDDAVGFCLEMEQAPVEGRDFRATAGGGFDFGDHAFADCILECG